MLTINVSADELIGGIDECDQIINFCTNIFLSAISHIKVVA